MKLNDLEKEKVFEGSMLLVFGLGIVIILIGLWAGKPIIGVFAGAIFAGIAYCLIALYRNEYLKDNKKL